MKVRSKITIMLLCMLIVITVFAGDIEFLIMKRYISSNIKTIYLLAVIIILYIYLADFVAKLIYKMTMNSSVKIEDEFKNSKIESLLSNIPGGMISVNYIHNKWKIDYVSLWCCETMGCDNQTNVDKEKIIDMIYEMDKPLVREGFNNILAGSEYSESEIRIKSKQDKLIWVKVKINGIYNVNGELNKVTVIIIDIDDVKKENEELLFRAQRDSLTGVFNKGRVIELIETYISEDKNKGAFIIVDIDNFKLFNDLLGHIYGDEALVKVSESLVKVFGENSLIGRIGGDEFCIFVKDVKSYEEVEEKVKGFLSLLRDNKIGDQKKLSLLVSVGIAKYPEHGENVRELYINSDKALYLTKSKGKNGYSIFNK